ncbi:DUF4352 domain-containing protein [Actinoplanes bogorensis]|uniref:DUF4352 domain-containing protein n=1 Tax=Paractinoplanes bogorensis TaxID=1610840 RepID=A0ABS5YZB2_9ACTN|nr:DUF4352 domain-containing protein [Actinoplanes bogorensis]MBU2668782.1 DUF4352 domain-containing protein [Actinoplanes bogorensis]
MTQPAHAIRTRRRWPWVAGVLVLLLAATGVWFFALRDADAGELVMTSGAGLDRPARDGAFTFTVSSVRCGIAVAGDEMVQATAKGSYCFVDLTVRNSGGKPALFNSSAQKAYDENGGEFSTDARAEVLENPGLPAFLGDIGPGTEARGTLVFDIPDGVRVSFLMLHESFSSAGAPISLR